MGAANVFDMADEPNPIIYYANESNHRSIGITYYAKVRRLADICKDFAKFRGAIRFFVEFKSFKGMKYGFLA